MVDISGSYDPNAEPSEFERLNGAFKMEIIESDIEEVSQKDDKGRCLKLTWRVTEGERTGALGFQRILMWFKGDEKTPGKTASIANQNFAAIRQATGKLTPAKSEELHHIPCIVTWGPQKNDANYDEVKSVKPASGFAAPPSNASRQFTPPAGQGRANGNGTQSAPWPR